MFTARNRFLYNKLKLFIIQIKCESTSSFESLVNKYEDKVLYNCVLERSKIKLGYTRNKALANKLKTLENKENLLSQCIEPIPIALKYTNVLNELENVNSEKSCSDDSSQQDQIVHFPYESTQTINSFVNTEEEEHQKTKTLDNVKQEISIRKSFYEPKDFSQWMSDYENYNEDDLNDRNEVNTWKINYGTPDPNSTISNVPCGGCGALLHCKDSSIPGYIPSEIYKNSRLREAQHLKAMACQRCYFLKNHNLALQVRVSPEAYPKVLEVIKPKLALVILMIDLLDFPCSIWPNVMEIIGSKRPVIVVGNKVDLLPKDSRGYLEHIKQVLKKNVEATSLSTANVKHVALISAKTGFGIEELITKLHNCWEYKGDVYLIGCTNVGKSTLFNALLQSDYCKAQAEDLVQRATTSEWPGTTLNLLKFPILRASGWRLFARTKRLISLNRIRAQEERLKKVQLRKTGNPRYATLMGHISRTFPAQEPVVETRDPFSVQGHPNAQGKIRMGVNEKDKDYALSKWFYDTPGVVQPDQVLHLLTTEELMLTMPKELIRPRTFSIKPKTSVFIGGLGRLDLLDGPRSIRITVFASKDLPVTICNLEDAASLYEELLGTPLLQVPAGNKERLSKWPRLEPSEEFTIEGEHWEVSSKDILLSSAGWISVTFGYKIISTFQAWTPEKRGIHIREPLLPKAIQLRGQKIRDSPSYRVSNLFLN